MAASVEVLWVDVVQLLLLTMVSLMKLEVNEMNGNVLYLSDEFYLLIEV